MAYYRMTGRGGFKWGRRLKKDDVVCCQLEVDEVPDYFEPASELEYVNFKRRRNGQKPLQELLKTKTDATKKTEEEQPLELGRDTSIKNALDALDQHRDEDWTESGRPRVSAVNEVLANWGEKTTTSAEIQSVAPEFRRPSYS